MIVKADTNPSRVVKGGARITTTSLLLDALIDARTVELQLLDALTDAQMLGARAHFVEPPIWEMGHVGWFQE